MILDPCRPHEVLASQSSRRRSDHRQSASFARAKRRARVLSISHKQREQMEPRRTTPPKLPQPPSGSAQCCAKSGSATALGRTRAPARLAECNTRVTRVLHSRVRFALVGHLRAAGEPSFGLCYLFRKSKGSDRLCVKHKGFRSCAGARLSEPFKSTLTR